MAFQSEAQRTCFTVDIVFCIIILVIAILTFGLGLILFFFYIPISVIVHFLIYIADKRSRRKRAKREQNFLRDQNKQHFTNYD